MRLIPLVFALVFATACASDYSGKEDVLAEGTFLGFTADISVLYLDKDGALKLVYVHPAGSRVVFSDIPQPGDKFRLVKTGETDHVWDCTFEITEHVPDNELACPCPP